MEIMNMNNSHLIAELKKIAVTKLGTEVSEIRFIGGGSFGKVYKAKLADGSTIAMKAFRTQGSQDREALCVNTLSKSTSVKMPEILFTYSSESIAALGMSFIEGSNVLNPVFLLKSKAQKEKFANDVVDGMLQWHEVKGEKFGTLKDPKYSSWSEYYRTEKQGPWLKALGELCDKGKFGKSKYKLLCQATEIFNKVCEEPESPVLIHSDLNIMNIMADPKSLKLIGFIDPGESLWADREYDLFQLRNMWGDSFGLYETYKIKHKMSEHTDFRVAYYGAMNEAACRLNGGLIMPLWEDLNNLRLKKEMKKYL